MDMPDLKRQIQDEIDAILTPVDDFINAGYIEKSSQKNIYKLLIPFNDIPRELSSQIDASKDKFIDDRKDGTYIKLVSEHKKKPLKKFQ